MLKRITQCLIIILLPILFIVGFMLAAQVARADNHLVTNASDSDPGSLRQAIADASDGDTITFNGDYTIYLNSTLVIDKRLTIDGSGHAVTVSGDSGGDGSPDVRVFYIQNTAIATLTHLSIVSGTADYGGGIYNNYGTLTIISSTLSGNSASGQGGGIYNNGTLTVISGIFSGNSTSGQGGGIYHNMDMLTVISSTFSGNSSDDGGGIYNYAGTVSVQNSTLSGNSANWWGGGISVWGGTLTVISSTLSGNLASDQGGGIYTFNIGDTVSVQNSTLSGNLAFDGGGIYHEGGTLTVISSTLSGNSADYGGGIEIAGGTVNVQNSTLSGNSATGTTDWYGGGAIDQWEGISLIINSTIVSNTAAYSGGGRDGLWLEDGTMTISNTIVAYNDTANCTISGGTFNGSDHNLANDATCPGFINSSTIYLGPLANNGGPSTSSGQATFTHALLPGSAALDAGNDATCLSTDQRGVARPQGAHCDIGAYEKTQDQQYRYNYLPVILKNVGP
ncbi:MAG: hypothetical protein JXM69_06820 [Anaerolineae bacterium]|nr:hypothetical protein [Anaerolineae bacterium]